MHTQAPDGLVGAHSMDCISEGRHQDMIASSNSWGVIDA
jgi:hypothetical protein